MDIQSNLYISITYNMSPNWWCSCVKENIIFKLFLGSRCQGILLNDASLVKIWLHSWTCAEALLWCYFVFGGDWIKWLLQTSLTLTAVTAGGNARIFPCDFRNAVKPVMTDNISAKQRWPFWMDGSWIHVTFSAGVNVESNLHQKDSCRTDDLREPLQITWSTP